ncbi:MAG TPA: YlmC/YmxH family sporulation protein [Clostridia bacterium]|nr:YlmC/YmxH family sporulation protein [Clostridia bacterium]
MEGVMDYREFTKMDVVDICSGACLGRVCNLEFDICSGTILSVSVPGKNKLLGLLKSTEYTIIPYCRIKKVGEDVILVEL